jgi:hypothetical protein
MAYIASDAPLTQGTRIYYGLWVGISMVFKIFEQLCLIGPIHMAMTYIHVPSDAT